MALVAYSSDSSDSEGSIHSPASCPNKKESGRKGSPVLPTAADLLDAADDAGGPAFLKSTHVDAARDKEDGTGAGYKLASNVRKRELPAPEPEPSSNAHRAKSSRRSELQASAAEAATAAAAAAAAVSKSGPKKDKVSAKDRVKHQRMNGQSGVGEDFRVWRSEEEMVLRQQYD